MDFQERLEKAIQRGQRASTARAQAAAQQALTEKELQRLHSQLRLELSERIEQCLRQLVDRFPGFEFETILDERGWGAAISRDDLRLRSPRERDHCYSRLELVIRPFSSYHLLELLAKATVCNKELPSHSHFQPLPEVDLSGFAQLIDNWVLEYAERYAAA